MKAVTMSDRTPFENRTREILEESQIRVIEAPDGPSALVQWEEHRDMIDILVTDMVMPGGLSGVELAVW